jgi:ABC-type lipoprotein export system ATPase subunit
MKEILKVNNLIKKFPKAGGEIDDADAISVLKGINFDVEQGEYVGIMGKSGCGKTTLLKILGFMDQQTDGDVIFDGANTNELWKEELTDIRRRKIGFVFQDFNLMDSLSVKENIMLPVLLDKKEQKECEEKAEALEKQFGIEHLQEKNPYELSGGERQRISIARAMLKDAPIVILDEATSYTDPENEAVIQSALAHLVQGKTLLVIAHRLSTIADADQIIVVNQGKIEATGTQTELLASCPLYQNMWEAHISVKDDGEVA